MAGTSPLQSQGHVPNRSAQDGGWRFWISTPLGAMGCGLACLETATKTLHARVGLAGDDYFVS